MAALRPLPLGSIALGLVPNPNKMWNVILRLQFVHVSLTMRIDNRTPGDVRFKICVM